MGRKGLTWSCNGSRAKEFSIKLTNQSLLVSDLSLCCMSGLTTFDFEKVSHSANVVNLIQHIACNQRVPEVNNFLHREFKMFFFFFKRTLHPFALTFVFRNPVIFFDLSWFIPLFSPEMGEIRFLVFFYLLLMM